MTNGKNKLFVKQRKGKDDYIEYMNEAISFDTETTSYIYNGNKIAWVWVWAICFRGEVIIGRTLKEFSEWIEKMREEYNLNEKRRIIVYVHNLGFDFSFLRKSFKINEVFASNPQKPMKVLINDVCELRCSYFLTGKSLALLGKEVGVKKLIGDLDYSLVRTPDTPITEKELGYIKNDVIIVYKYIKKQIEKEGNITGILLTKTGYVRRIMKKACQSKDKYFEYRSLMKFLSLREYEYTACKKAFAGGYTHANYRYIGKEIHNVYSNDFSSSYPAVACSEKFPMSRGMKFEDIEDIETFHKISQEYCMIFTAIISGCVIKPNIPDCYISESKTWALKGEVTNNGRIFSADFFCIEWTNIDLEIFLKTYDFDNLVLKNVICFKKDYLPKPIVETILTMYSDKTKLKNVSGREEEYMLSKENVNSVYGMMVTDIVRDTICYDEDREDGCWYSEKGDAKSQLDKYNKSKNRVLYYPWGIFITAYARRNLWLMILEEGQDYIYSDTDSTKYLHKNRHTKFFKEYNKEIKRKLEEVCEHYELDKELINPIDIKGKHHPLGAFEEEKPYYTFKTLGAKRYMVEYMNTREKSITVAGLGKIKGMQYIKGQKKNCFEFFDNNMIIPAEHTGKSTHTIIEKEYELDVKDYTGNTTHVHTYGGCHLSPAPFQLSLADAFLKFLENN